VKRKGNNDSKGNDSEGKLKGDQRRLRETAAVTNYNHPEGPITAQSSKDCGGERKERRGGSEEGGGP